MPTMKHKSLSVDLTAGTWSYIDIQINEDADKYEVPRNIILTNKSTTKNMFVKLLTKAEGNGGETASDGLFLKAGGQIAFTNIGLNYRVGATLETSDAANQELVASSYSFARVDK